MSKYKLGDSVKLIDSVEAFNKPQEPYYAKLYDKLTCLEAVVVEVEEDKYSYNLGQRYLIEFKEDKGDLPNWFICESDLLPTEKTEELIQLYADHLKRKEDEAYARKYKWGKCEKCGSPLDMHYGKWCPTCEKPEPKIVKVHELFKVMRWCEERMKGFKEAYWEMICESYNVSNDILLDIFLDPDSEMDQLISKEFNLELNKSHTFEISW